jgi:uncharacterized protein YggE
MVISDKKQEIFIMKHRTGGILAVLAICFASLVLTACSSLAGHQQEMVRTITVSGTGEVKVKPDTALFTIQVSELKDTTTEALQETSSKMNKLRTILESFSIDEKDLQLQSLSLRPEYDWIDGKQVLKGQRASQSIQVKVTGIDKDTKKLGNIIDDLGQVSNITLGNITFDKDDKTEAIRQARKLAVEKATEKARVLALASNMVLGAPITIGNTASESIVQERTYQPKVLMATASMAEGNASTDTPAGNLDVTSSITIVYQMEPTR